MERGWLLIGSYIRITTRNMLQLVFGTYTILDVLASIWQARRLDRRRFWHIDRILMQPIWYIERILVQPTL